MVSISNDTIQGIFEHKMSETGEWKKLSSDNLNDFYHAVNIVFFSGRNIPLSDGAGFNVFLYSPLFHPY